MAKHLCLKTNPINKTEDVSVLLIPKHRWDWIASKETTILPVKNNNSFSCSSSNKKKLLLSLLLQDAVSPPPHKISPDVWFTQLSERQKMEQTGSLHILGPCRLFIGGGGRWNLEMNWRLLPHHACNSAIDTPIQASRLSLWHAELLLRLSSLSCPPRWRCGLCQGCI